MKLNDPTILDANSLELLGIAIKDIDNESSDQRHVGLLYRDNGSQMRMCDLAWHYQFRDQPCPNDYSWVDVNMQTTNKFVVVALIQKIVEKNKLGQIPYAMVYGGMYFDRQTGVYLKDYVGEGLTCATFIMAVFESMGLPIIDVNSWKPRWSDRRWQEKTIDLLRNGASERHIELLTESIGAPRFRPEEVTASSTLETQPAKFGKGRWAGFVLLQVLKTHASHNPTIRPIRRLLEWIAHRFC